jgi:transposase-like protein
MQTKTRSSRTSSRWHSASEVEEILAKYRNGGLTQRVFAQGAGIGVSTLQLWLRQAQSAGRLVTRRSSSEASRSAISLLEVELAGKEAEREGAEARGPYYEIQFRGGECLRLSSGFLENDARRLLALLREEH